MRKVICKIILTIIIISKNISIILTVWERDADLKGSEPPFRVAYDLVWNFILFYFYFFCLSNESEASGRQLLHMGLKTL